MKLNVATMMKGAAMGIAEVIPGVSGGTIAFISGIYEDLLRSIQSFDLPLLKMLWQKKFSDSWGKINGWFLMSLGSGMVAGIVFGILVITWLMAHYAEPLWGFFFGLVLASAWMIGKHIGHWDMSKVVALIAGLGTALLISIVSPAEGSTSPFYIFLAGMIAISAFILPGVSGSFMLLLMGMYTLIIPSLKSILIEQDIESMMIISIFAMGCIVGILSFSRVLNWLFAHYRDHTFVVLTGFLLGSLYKIWPWRNISNIIDKETGLTSSISSLAEYQTLDLEKIKILKESNVLPLDYWMSSPKILLTVLSAIIGLGMVLWMQSRQNKVPNVKQ